MKVLYITNSHAPYYTDFYNEITKYCDLTVAFFGTRDQQGKSEGRDAKWFSEQKYMFNYMLLKQTKFLNGHICYGIKEIVQDKTYDLIVLSAYSEYSGMYAIHQMKKNKIPFVLMADGGFIKSGKGLKERFKKALISSSNWWIGSGKATRKYLEFYGADNEHIYMYPFTSMHKKDIIEHPTSADEKQRIKKELGINETKVILNVGQFIYRKGNDLLIEACKDFDKSIGIYIVGGIPTDEYLELKRKYNLSNLHFIDFKTKDELKKFYRASDVFCCPTREDIWGLVINEAMSQGLPIITTDHCIAGLELIENGENGYIVPINDVSAIREKISIILNDNDLLERMSQNNLEKIRFYTIENMAKVFSKIINDIVKKR